MQCTHGSLETFQTKTRATDCTSVFPSQCCCWKHFGWMVVISPPWISSSLHACSQWAFQPAPPTWAPGRTVTEQGVQPFNFTFLTGWMNFKNRKTCSEEKEREQWAQLISYSHLQGCNCPPFPGSCAMFPKLEACFCKTSEHRFVFFFQLFLSVELSWVTVCVLYCTNPHSIYVFVLNWQI